MWWLMGILALMPGSQGDEWEFALPSPIQEAQRDDSLSVRSPLLLSNQVYLLAPGTPSLRAD